MGARVLIPLLVWLATAISGAGAQTVSLAVVEQGTYSRSFDVMVAERFDVVTLIDTAGNEISAAEWVQTELIVEIPGVFRLQHQVYWQSWCDLLLCLDCCGETGEYVIPLGVCVSPSEDLLVARNAYLDVSGVIPDDFVLTIRGLPPGDSQPSSIAGSAADCRQRGEP